MNRLGVGAGGCVPAGRLQGPRADHLRGALPGALRDAAAQDAARAELQNQ